MTLEELRDQMKSMSTEELVELHKNIRSNRRVRVSTSQETREKKSSKKRVKGIGRLLTELSKEDKAELIKALEE